MGRPGLNRIGGSVVGGFRLVLPQPKTLRRTELFTDVLDTYDWASAGGIHHKGRSGEEMIVC